MRSLIEPTARRSSPSAAGDLVRKAAAAGHGEGSIAALTEVLGTG